MIQTSHTWTNEMWEPGLGPPADCGPGWGWAKGAPREGVGAGRVNPDRGALGFSVLFPVGHLTFSRYPGAGFPARPARCGCRSLGTPRVSRGRVRGPVCTCACPPACAPNLCGMQACRAALLMFVTKRLGRGLKQGSFCLMRCLGPLCGAVVLALGRLWPCGMMCFSVTAVPNLFGNDTGASVRMIPDRLRWS